MGNNIVIFGATQSGKTTLMGYLATAMLRHPQFNDEVLQKLKLIRRLTDKDEFHIGNVFNPVNVNKEIILPSFVSLDRDELRRFTDKQSSEGTTKRLHRKNFTICVSEHSEESTVQQENANIPCTFIDTPGFRQRLSDKYRGFYEGDAGIAVLKLQEILKLWSLLNSTSERNEERAEAEELERRLFEPIRIWCGFRSPSRLVIVISQIDRILDKTIEKDIALERRRQDIENAISCVQLYTSQFCDEHILISPISITLKSKENEKKNSRMAVFFQRVEENIYRPLDIPGSGSLIQCINQIISYNTSSSRSFEMASVYQAMRAIVNYSPKTALNVHAIHGSIHENDTIMMGPVVDKQSKETIFTKCTISSLKADGTKDPSHILFEGNVGGIIFKSISDLTYRTEYRLDSNQKKSELSILKTTILYSNKVKKGDILEFHFFKKDYLTVNGHLDDVYRTLLSSLMPFDQLFLIYHGKKISVNIVEIVADPDKIKLSVILARAGLPNTRCFALPCDSHNLLLFHDNVLIAIPQTFYLFSSGNKTSSTIYSYVNASIVELKQSMNYHSVKLDVPAVMELDDLFQSVMCYEHTVLEDWTHSYKIPYQDPKNNLSIYAILTKIRRQISSKYGRNEIRNYGRINIQLINDSEGIN